MAIFRKKHDQEIKLPLGKAAKRAREYADRIAQSKTPPGKESDIIGRVPGHFIKRPKNL